MPEAVLRAAGSSAARAARPPQARFARRIAVQSHGFELPMHASAACGGGGREGKIKSFAEQSNIIKAEAS